MTQRIFAAGVGAALVGAVAVALTPAAGPRPSGTLARAGADVPVWGFVVVGAVLIAGIVLLVAGLLRRRHDGVASPDPTPTRAADEPADVAEVPRDEDPTS